MYKTVFGWIKKGGKPDEAGLRALYALMEPTLRSLKMKRLSPKGLDDRLCAAFPLFYEYFALVSAQPASYWQNLDGSFPEKKAERDLRREFKALWKELYPPKPKAAPKA